MAKIDAQIAAVEEEEKKASTKEGQETKTTISEDTNRSFKMKKKVKPH
jgi:hypothetical protein